MRNVIFLSISLLLLVSCHSGQNTTQEVAIVNVRAALQAESSISMKEDVERIEYIPLETNDSCLVSNLLNLQVTENYLFMYNGKTNQVLQFDRKGKFVKNISCAGNGPGEYDLVIDLVTDERAKELFVFQMGGNVSVYSFGGAFLRNDTTIQHAGGMYVLPDGKRVLKGLTMSPIQLAPWMAALQTGDDGLQTKSPFPHGLSADACFMKEICFSPSVGSALFFTACNDTVFRAGSEGITPAYVLKRDNPEDYYLGISDINRLRDDAVETDETIGMYDMFETPLYFYIRIYKGEAIYIQRYDKKTAGLKSFRVPDAYLECSSMIPGNNVIGIDNDVDGGVPFWPEYVSADGIIHAQVVSAYAISQLREKGYLKNAPAALTIGEDSNPVIILYAVKTP